MAHGFATAPDGTRIAYEVCGEGPPLLLSNGVTTSTLYWERLRARWQRNHRVVCWDLPGHGRSEVARSERLATYPALPELVAAVMDATGIDRAVQIGWSTGSQLVLETARRFPDRCRALVSLLGAAGRVLDTATLPIPGPVIDRVVRQTPTPVFDALYRAITRLADGPIGVPAARLLRLVGEATDDADVRRIIAHIRTVDPRTVQIMVGSAQAHSAHDLLPTLSLPLLIVSGDRDPFAPADVGASMHAATPASDFLRLPTAAHTALLDHAEQIAEAVEGFLSDLPP